MLKRLFYPIGYFFSQEALDERLVPPPASAKAQSVLKTAKPSKWFTMEYTIYIICFIIVIPTMFRTAMEASNETNPNYWIYKGILSDGWINGRKVDNSDAQYRFFRDNLPLLLLLMLIHLTLKKTILKKFPSVGVLRFDMIFGLLFLFGAHGFNSIRIAVHCGTSFLITKYIKNKKWAIRLTWLYGISTLFINVKWSAVKFASISPMLLFLDSFKGVVERWDVFYNFTLLRILSFNLDLIKKRSDLSISESSSSSSVLQISSPNSKKIQDLQLQKIESDNSTDDSINSNNNILLHNRQEKYPTTDSESEGEGAQLTRETTAPKNNYLDDKERLDAPLELTDYNLQNYVSYLTYTPLFIAGPILTFNDYIYQSRNTSPSITTKSVSIYALRFLFCLLTMEFLLHYIYVVALSKLKAWYNDTPYQISMIGLFNLNIIWLKLLIPWRLFRLWALLDKIDPPENMIRCMSNNNSAISFWRAWHRSFSRWSIRYIYVPLGGSHNRILTSLCVFSFVAIWHDIQLRLLLWGWLVVLFLLPEVLITKYFTKFENKWWYRYVCGIGSVINIWMMMIANLFGFCLGPDGSKDFLKKLFYSVEGAKFFVVSSVCLFIAVQVQNEIRESEKRRGIDLKC